MAKKPADKKLPKKAGKSLALAGTSMPPMAFGGVEYKVTKVVTVPLLKQPAGTPVAFTVGSEMYTGKAISDDRAAPTLIDVIDLATGRNAVYIVPAILRARFEQEYDGEEGGKHDYVGLSFAVHKSSELSGTGDRKYRNLEIVEITPA